MKRLTVLVLVATTAVAADEPPAFEGLWIHHDTWQMAPPEINEDGDIHKYASAAIFNICPDGAFRLATGVIYQSTKSPGVQIGASDGLAIYSGTWSRTDKGVSVKYQLVSAEFGNLLDDPAAASQRAAELRVYGTKIEFPFTNIRGRVHPLTFTSAARYEKQVGDEFVECGTRKPSPSPPKRPRTGRDRGAGAT